MSSIVDRGAVARTMSKGRLEAFSDGVIAIIIITIMVLELKPHLGRPVCGGHWAGVVVRAAGPVIHVVLAAFWLMPGAPQQKG